MDSFELNKIMGAILGTLLFIMGVGFVAEAIYSPIEGRGPGYPLPEPEATAVAEADTEEEPAVPLAVLLASANAEQGAAAARRCQSCHNFEAGAGAKQGPNLYDVVNRVIGSEENYAYSDILLEHEAAGDLWTYANLDAFLLSPSGFAPGTKMAFAGVKDDAERAHLLAYLQTLSPDPVPFPEPEAEAPADADAEAAAGDEPAADDAEAAAEDEPADDAVIEVDPEAVVTPTETQDESPVEGTPISETTVEGEAAPAAAEEEAAPAEEPAASEAPATDGTLVAPGQ